jgi:hypothetical protein
MIGTRQLTQHERVAPVGLAARGAESRPGGGNLVRVDRDHAKPGVEQPLDQHPVRPLDRDPHHLQPHKRPAQSLEPRLVVRERGSQQLLARFVSDEHVVLLRRPINAGAIAHLRSSSCGHTARQRRDQEVPLRALIDRPCTGLRPVAALRPHAAGRGRSCSGPPTGKHRRPSPGGGRGQHDHTPAASNTR